MGFEIPIDVDFFGHPKTLKLITILDRAEADVYPLRLWRWAASYARDGRLPGDVRQIEAAIGWRGKPGRLHSALVEAEFIESDGFTLHDWMNGVGRAIAIYEEKKRKQREKRLAHSGILPEECQKNSPYPGRPTLDVPSVKPGIPEPAVAAAPVPAPSASPIPDSPETDKPFGGGGLSNDDLQAVFQAALKNGNPPKEPTPQDDVIRQLLQLVPKLKSSSSLKIWRQVIEACRARFGAQAVMDWLMATDVNVGKSAYEMEKELIVLHKGNDVASKVKLKVQNEKRSEARRRVADKMLDFLRQHSPTCAGCKDCERDRTGLRELGFKPNEIPLPGKSVAS